MAARFFIFISIFLTACGGGSSSDEQEGSTMIQEPIEDPILTFEEGRAIGNNAVFLTDGDLPNSNHIYYFDIESEQYQRLNPSQGNPGQVGSVKMSNDGRKLIYLSDKEENNSPQLFLANMDGDFNERISDDNEEIAGFTWGADSDLIVYRISDQFLLKSKRVSNLGDEAIDYQLPTSNSYRSIQYKLSHDSSTLLVGASYGSTNNWIMDIFYFDISSGTLLSSVTSISTESPGTVNFSRNGNYFTVYDFNSVRLFNRANSEVLNLLNSESGASLWSEIDERLYLAYFLSDSLNGQIQQLSTTVFNADTNESLTLSNLDEELISRRIPGSSLSRGMNDISWSQDGNYISYVFEFTGEPNNLLAVDTQTGEIAMRYPDQSPAIIDFYAISPANQVLVNLSFDEGQNYQWMMGAIGAGFSQVFEELTGYSRVAWSIENEKYAFAARSSASSGILKFSRMDIETEEFIEISSANGEERIRCFIANTAKNRECRRAVNFSL